MISNDCVRGKLIHTLGYHLHPISGPQPFQAPNHSRRTELPTKPPRHKPKCRPSAIYGRPEKDIDPPYESVDGWNRCMGMLDWLFDNW